MAGFNSHRALTQRLVDEGATTYAGWRKAPAVVTAQGFWQDLSMAPGNPRPNYYASSPLVAATLAHSTDGGIYHGKNVSPSTKHVARIMAMTVTAGAVPLPMILCDYLLYYPFVDEGTVDEEQVMDNTVTLSRYATGDNVQMMAVVVASHTAGGATFTVNYTNSAGVAGRTSQAVKLNTQFVNGTIVTTATATAQCFGPFIPLQSGDTGVRSVQGVTVASPGDVGLFTLVLVKPLADVSLRGIDAPVEVDFRLDRPSLPVVVDDAYLNWLVMANGSLTGANILGDITTVWSS